MSSDEYFDDELDSAFLNEVDAIEAAHVGAHAATSRSTGSKPPPFKPATASRPSAASTSALARSQKERDASPHIIEIQDSSSDYGFDDFPVDDLDFAQIDQACQRELDEFERRKRQYFPQAAAGPSNLNSLIRRPSRGAQLTLFGEVAQETDPLNSGEPSSRTFQRTRSSLRQMPLPGHAKKTKQWDRTAYAKTGWRKPKPSEEQETGDGEEEPLEFEQFPAPEIPVGPAPRMKLCADRLAAKTWLYPLNKPKRDYQYNIVKNCLLENTLVALPTGLGKTFIAGVVMLNYYHWFPQGKVVFVAPTKPLVSQQIDACHKTCGIPGSVAAELTGNVAKDKRIHIWRTKRVFYATPQTLMNDLINGHVDALDFVLIVIDEAHRATGDYAYAQVVRWMMQHNPHFRVLALTATPGGKPEAVQDIVDALHISHIEIRSESDADLKKYLHTKFEQEHFVQMTPDIAVLRDALAGLMNPLIKKVQSAGFLKNGNVIPTMIHPFRCQATINEMIKSRAPQYAISAVSQLGVLARAMGYLMENSISMCYGYLQDVVKGEDDTGGKKALRKSDTFKKLIKTFEEQAARGFSMHPKMDVLKTLLVDHFAKQLPEDAEGSNVSSRQSRAMVFVSFRECVEEIVELLNKESPIIRAKPFIGQGTDKQGKKGYGQKQQLEVIEQFKSGTYNVLVSTSIGEEGLDIGEVDLIVCYDAQKTPIRMLQRIGRTGRKASGTVHILLAKGREEHNWQKAQSNYAEVQHFIVRASDLEVYGDVDRLLPDDIEPECVEMEMEIEEYIREDRASRKDSLATDGSPTRKGKRRKRSDDPMRNVPASAAKGFVSVGELLVKSGARRKKITERDIAHADEDDSDDNEIEAGIFGPRRTVSASVADKPATGKKKPLVRSATAGPSTKTKAKKKFTKRTTLMQLESASEDDSADEAIECGLLASKQSLGSSPEIPLIQSIIDLWDSPGPPLERSARAMFNPSPDQPLQRRRLKRKISSSSPERPLKAFSETNSGRSQSKKLSPPRRSSDTPERSISPTSRNVPEESALGNDSIAWLVDDDDDFDLPVIQGTPAKSSAKAGAADREPLFLGSSPVPETSPLRLPSDDELVFLDEPLIVSPRPLPARIMNASPSYSDDHAPAATFAVRAPGRGARKRIAAEALELESSPLAAPPLSQRRLQHDRPPSPFDSPAAARAPPKKKRKFKDTAEAGRHNFWIDVEAAHSGDELSAGGESDAETIPDSDDRNFVDEPLETQMSPSYDQSAVYRQSLLTQVPGRGGPVFANGPVRRGRAAFGPNRPGSSRYRRTASSSPRNEDEHPDEYVFDSFVVDDDAEISFAGGPSSDF
ncbi:hypothetical protein C8Q74DRAFT_1458838 [Fomes fomentarius]|nr:hypothetical protein C8Q74DRAFT_1458838 [Fomes fomentarius]